MAHPLSRQAGPTFTLPAVSRLKVVFRRSDVAAGPSLNVRFVGEYGMFDGTGVGGVFLLLFLAPRAQLGFML